MVLACVLSLYDLRRQALLEYMVVSTCLNVVKINEF